MPRFDGKDPEENGELIGRGIGAINGKCINGTNDEFQQNFQFSQLKEKPLRS